MKSRCGPVNDSMSASVRYLCRDTLGTLVTGRPPGVQELCTVFMIFL